MREITVLHILPKLESGGIEALIKNWYNKTHNNNINFKFAVNLLEGKTYDFFVNNGEEVFLLPNMKEISIFKFAKETYLLIKKINPDIIHLTSSPTYILILIIAKYAKVKSRIIHAHTNLYQLTKLRLFNFFILKIMKLLSKIFSTKMLSCSIEAANYCFPKSINKNKKYELLLNGIDINRFAFNLKKRALVRDRYNLNSKLVIGSIGRLTSQKNFTFLINIFYQIKKIKNDVHLLIIGEGDDDHKLKKLVHDMDLVDDVSFLGVVNDVENYYSAMDIFVLPSKYEGLGIVFIEAQANGLICYASDMVPKSAKITDLINFVSLKESPLFWANFIMNQSKSINRNGYVQLLENSGYSESDTSSRMIQIYNEEYTKVGFKYVE